MSFFHSDRQQDVMTCMAVPLWTAFLSPCVIALTHEHYPNTASLTHWWRAHLINVKRASISNKWQTQPFFGSSPSLLLCLALLWDASGPTQGLTHSQRCATTEQHPILNLYSKGCFTVHQHGTRMKVHGLWRKEIHAFPTWCLNNECFLKHSFYSHFLISGIY